MATVKRPLMLYRDLLRLIRHIAGDSPKAQHLRTRTVEEFRRNADVTDVSEIEMLKYNAVRIISNYLVMEESNKIKGHPFNEDYRMAESPPKVKHIVEWHKDMMKNHFQLGKNGFTRKYAPHHGFSKTA